MPNEVYTLSVISSYNHHRRILGVYKSKEHADEQRTVYSDANTEDHTFSVDVTPVIQPKVPEGCQHESLMMLRSQFIKICYDCNQEWRWDLDPGQKPLL